MRVVEQMRSLRAEHFEMRFGRGGKAMVVGGQLRITQTKKNQKKQKNPLIHARNSPTDVDTLYNLILTEINKVSIIVPILQVNKLELRH